VDDEVARFLNQRFSSQGGAGLADRDRRSGPSMSWDELRAFQQQSADDHRRHLTDNLWMLLVPGAVASSAGFAGALGKAAKHGYRRVQLQRLGAPESLRNWMYPQRLRKVVRAPEYRREMFTIATGAGRVAEEVGGVTDSSRLQMLLRFLGVGGEDR